MICSGPEITLQEESHFSFSRYVPCGWLMGTVGTVRVYFLALVQLLQALLNRPLQQHLCISFPWGGFFLKTAVGHFTSHSDVFPGQQTTWTFSRARLSSAQIGPPFLFNRSHHRQVLRDSNVLLCLCLGQLIKVETPQCWQDKGTDTWVQERSSQCFIK